MEVSTFQTQGNTRVTRIAKSYIKINAKPRGLSMSNGHSHVNKKAAVHLLGESICQATNRWVNYGLIFQSKICGAQFIRIIPTVLPLRSFFNPPTNINSVKYDSSFILGGMKLLPAGEKEENKQMEEAEKRKRVWGTCFSRFL